MTTNYTITNIKRQLIRAFATLDGWFDWEDEFHDYKSDDGQYVRGIFEAIVQINHSLMLVIDNAGNHAMRLAVENKKNTGVSDYNLNSAAFEEGNINRFLEAIAVQPGKDTVHRSLPEIRSELRDQLDRCLCHLELLKNGEGFLYKTTGGHTEMDIYHCMHLLSLQLWKCADALTKVALEFSAQRS